MENTIDTIKLIIKESLSGLTVALALIPISVAYAFVAGAPPEVGLYSSIIVGFITAVIGGRPGMITAATGALAVIMTALVIDYGLDYLFAAVILMGIIQIIASLFGVGKFIRLVPIPAILGFVNGLAIIIFLSQLKYFKVPTPQGDLVWLSGEALWLTLSLVALTMVIIQFLPRISQIIPSTLVGVLLVTFIVFIFKLPVATIGEGIELNISLPTFHLPQVPLNLHTLAIIFPYSFTLAAIGLIESLITLTLVDDYTHTHGNGNLECFGQGAGNFVAGFFGAFASCATIGPTMLNLQSGGRRRLSGILAALGLLFLILLAVPIIHVVPIAALVGLMFMIVIDTFAWSTFRIIHKIPRADAFVLIAVTIISVFKDLGTAVLLGVILSALAFAWESAQNIRVRVFLSAQGRKTYKVYGPLFFGSTRSFLAHFKPNQDPKEVIIDFKHSRLSDHSAIDTIDALIEKYNQAGVTLTIRHLNEESKRLLAKGSSVIEFEESETIEETRESSK